MRAGVDCELVVKVKMTVVRAKRNGRVRQLCRSIAPVGRRQSAPGGVSPRFGTFYSTLINSEVQISSYYLLHLSL